MKYCLLFLGLGAVLIIGCYEDSYRRKYPGAEQYFFFDNAEIVLENTLNITSFTEKYPVIKKKNSPKNHVFFYQRRDDVYYLNGLKFDLQEKKFDVQLFISVPNPSERSFGYTNTSLTNLKVYYYELLKPTITFSNQGHLYFSNTEASLKGSWQVSVALTNQEASIYLNQLFSKRNF